MSFTINIYNYNLMNQNNTVNIYPAYQHSQENSLRPEENNFSPIKYKIYDTKELFDDLKKTDDAFNQYFEKFYGSISNPVSLVNSNRSTIQFVAPSDINPGIHHVDPHLRQQDNFHSTTLIEDQEKELSPGKKYNKEEESSSSDSDAHHITPERSINKKNYSKQKISLIKSKKNSINCKWTLTLDEMLKNAVKEYGTQMSKVALKVPGKSAKQCYDRWINHIDPNLDKSPWKEREISVIKQHGKNGKWVQLSKLLQEQSPNKTAHRAPNDLKNYWYSNYKKN